MTYLDLQVNQIADYCKETSGVGCLKCQLWGRTLFKGGMKYCSFVDQGWANFPELRQDCTHLGLELRQAGRTCGELPLGLYLDAVRLGEAESLHGMPYFWWRVRKDGELDFKVAASETIMMQEPGELFRFLHPEIYEEDINNCTEWMVDS